MRYWEILSTKGNGSRARTDEAGISALRAPLTLKDLHQLKLQKKRREAEWKKKLPLLKSMYGQSQKEDDQQQTDREKQKQKNREHIRKSALRQIKNQRKRRQERDDTIARYLEGQKQERERRIKKLVKKFDQINSKGKK